jgi:ElaA protein
MKWFVKSFDELSTLELYTILKARVDVFVVEQHCHYPDLDDLDKVALHIWAENNHQLMAYCRIFPPDIKYPEASIGRVLTTQEFRKKGLGKILVTKAIASIKEHFDSTEIKISAQDYLIEFYQSFGFVSTGKKYLEDDIPHTEMLMQ